MYCICINKTINMKKTFSSQSVRVLCSVTLSLPLEDFSVDTVDTSQKYDAPCPDCD